MPLESHALSPKGPALRSRSRSLWRSASGLGTANKTRSNSLRISLPSGTQQDEHGAIGKHQQEAITSLRQAALNLQRVSVSMAVALEKMTPEPKVMRSDQMRSDHIRDRHDGARAHGDLS